MAGPKAEQSALWLGIFIGCTYLGGLIFTAIGPSFNSNWSTNTAQDTAHYHLPYTAQQLRGRLVYEREGCMYCHSQQIRPLTSEMIRYGIGSSPAPAADEREYVYDEPHFLGTKRNGPDLSREGGKYSDDWQYSHLFNPQMMTPGSIMPQFTWLFNVPNPADPSSVPEPTQECKDLVAYIQSLGSERQVYDPTLNGGKGGWRPWLKPQDAVISQETGEAAVNQAAHPVKVPGGTTATPAQ